MLGNLASQVTCSRARRKALTYQHQVFTANRDKEVATLNEEIQTKAGEVEVNVDIITTGIVGVVMVVIQEVVIGVVAEAITRDKRLINFIRTTTKQRHKMTRHMTLDLLISSLTSKWMLMRSNKKLINITSNNS